MYFKILLYFQLFHFVDRKKVQGGNSTSEAHVELKGGIGGGESSSKNVSSASVVNTPIVTTSSRSYIVIDSDDDEMETNQPKHASLIQEATTITSLTGNDLLSPYIHDSI